MCRFHGRFILYHNFHEFPRREPFVFSHFQIALCGRVSALFPPPFGEGRAGDGAQEAADWDEGLACLR